jgi:Lar family restriction alleviation protein
MMSKEKLKPCPFCGGKGSMFIGQFGTFYYVSCESCKAQTTEYTTRAEAIEAWNKQVGVAELESQLTDRDRLINDLGKIIKTKDFAFEQLTKCLNGREAEMDKLYAQLAAYRWIPVSERLPEDKDEKIDLICEYTDGQEQRQQELNNWIWNMAISVLPEWKKVTYWRLIILPPLPEKGGG